MMTLLTPDEGTKFIVIASGVLSAQYACEVAAYVFFFVLYRAQHCARTRLPIWTVDGSNVAV